MDSKRFYMTKHGDLYDKDNGLLMLDFGYSYDGVNCKKIIDLLNDLHESNHQLNEEYLKLRHRHSLLHDVCCDLECDSDSLKKDVKSLENENEQLQKSLSSSVEKNRKLQLILDKLGYEYIGDLK